MIIGQTENLNNGKRTKPDEPIKFSSTRYPELLNIKKPIKNKDGKLEPPPEISDFLKKIMEMILM